MATPAFTLILAYSLKVIFTPFHACDVRKNVLMRLRMRLNGYNYTEYQGIHA